MDRQMPLPLAINDQDQLRMLWEQIPEPSRIKLMRQFAILMAQAARTPTQSPQPESNHEITEHQLEQNDH